MSSMPLRIQCVRRRFGAAAGRGVAVGCVRAAPAGTAAGDGRRRPRFPFSRGWWSRRGRWLLGVRPLA